MKKILDVGCGQAKHSVEGAQVVGVDFYNAGAADVAHNLNKYPWPFKSNEFDGAVAEHVIEHLPDTVRVMGELWRIVKGGGMIKIKTPHFSSAGAYENPTHVRYFSLYTFDMFSAGRKGWEVYSRAKFHVVKRRLNFWRVRHALLSPIVDFMINLKPRFYERYFSCLFGGPEEIEVWLEVVK